jgi:hypothetical protein
VAAIGEQLSEHLAEGDEICGITVSCRRDQDLLQIWNTHSRLASEASIIDAVHKLLPDIRFSAEFYKCRLKIQSHDFSLFLNFFTANQAHDAFEGQRKRR